jgi:hypothetical protein
MTYIWSIILTSVLLSGCAGTAALQSTLQSRSGELVYLHDTPPVPDKRKGTLKLGSFVVDDVLPPATTVQKESGFLLPLLVFNMWKYGYTSSLGAAQIANDYKTFMRESLVEELKRSSTFAYADDQADIEIDLKIKTVAMNAPIERNGHFLFAVYAVSWGDQTLAGPVDVVMTADAVWKQDGKELMTREVQGRGRAGILGGRIVQMEDYTTAMIEALSLAIKDLNENLVKEINSL